MGLDKEGDNLGCVGWLVLFENLLGDLEVDGRCPS
jgi:hypothetical protein